MSSRIDELEMRNTLLEKEISELNEVVTTLSAELDTMKKYIKIKLDKIENTMNEAGGEKDFQSVSDEAAANKPPHY